jgi:hypothetical protein
MYSSSSDISDDSSTNVVDISMLDIDYALLGCTLHCICNEFDITIFYNDILVVSNENLPHD